MRLFVLTTTGLVILGVAVLRADEPRQKETSHERVTLLGLLAPSQYPKAVLAGGATMSDGGDPRMQSVKCATVMTTPDSFEKVVSYYADKYGEGKKDAEARVVAVQDDSAGRPVAVRVIVVNKPDSSTTLVISRGESEKETHIAWTHHLRFPPRRVPPGSDR